MLLFHFVFRNSNIMTGLSKQLFQGKLNFVLNFSPVSCFPMIYLYQSLPIGRQPAVILASDWTRGSEVAAVVV